MARFFLTLLALLLVSACDNDTHPLDDGIGVVEAYAYATTAKNGVVFAVIDNVGAQEDRLTGAASDIAGRVELHETVMEGDVMTMRRVDSLAVPPKGTLTLSPQGAHIMLLGLKKPLVAGETFDLTLTFATVGEMTFPVDIVPPGTGAPSHDHPEGGGHAH